MSEPVNDLDGGGNPPTTEQVIRVSAHLQTKNLEHGPRPTHRELQARNFAISIASVQRILKKAGIKSTPSQKDIVHEATDRASRERSENRKAKEPTGGPFKIEDMPDGAELVQKIAGLVDGKNTSAMLAIMENRYRMALNIVIAEAMAAKPGLLLLDMRGTAALVDALTCASKLSGGNALDIRYPTEEEKRSAEAGESPSGDGRPMKDITPTRTVLADQFAEFRRNRHAANGKGA